MSTVTCPECNQECTPVLQDDSFDYSGTHCTGGKDGTHHIPVYYTSDCCEAELEDYNPSDEDSGPDYSDYNDYEYDDNDY